MHGPHGVTHIYASHRHLCCEYIAQCAAACRVAVVHEVLNGHFGLAAYLCKDRCAVGIGHVLLVGIYLDHRTASHHGVVRRVVLLGVVGMQSMSHVGTYHERTLDGLHHSLLAAALLHADACQYVFQHRRCCALLRAAARLLVVEDGQHLCHVVQSGVEHGVEPCVHHCKVVEATAVHKLLIQSCESSPSSVVEREVEVDDILHPASSLLSYDIEQYAVSLQFLVYDS